MKIKTYARNISIVLTLAFFLHVCGMIATQTIANYTSEKISSKKQLEKVVAQEKRNLNCNKKIKIVFTKYTEAFSEKKNKDYVLKLGGKMATNTMVRHEIFHICDNHLDYTGNTLYYLFIAEPQATIYQVFRIKL